jgi:RNA polymerase sigma factor (sigma-70 family)
MGDENTDKLAPLAWAVVNKITPRQQDRQDYFQTAYLAGLSATRVAESNGKRTSSSVLFHRMQQAVYRSMHERNESIEDDEMPAEAPACCVETLDTLGRYLPLLTKKQRRTVRLVYARGMSIDDAAQHEGVERNTIYYRLQAAMIRMRSAAGETTGDEVY